MGSLILRAFEQGPLFVSPEFVGMSCNYAAAPPEGVIYGANRTWDSRGGTASRFIPKDIAVSAGVYDWTAFDGLMAANSGKRIHIMLGCPPDWMVSRAAVGGATAYGGKSNMCPDDLEAYADLIRAMAVRARDKWGITGMVWDMWNEINGTGFYNDSLALLGPYVRRMAIEIRKHDPSATILAPNTNATSGSYLTNMLALSDGKDGRIADYCNGVSMHTYHMSYSMPNVVRMLYSMINEFRAAATAGGMPGAELHMNECGANQSFAKSGRMHGLRMVVAAALGCRSYIGYTYDHATFAISPFIEDWNQFASLISGRWIDYCAVENGNTFVLVSNGTRHVLTL